MAAMAIHFGFFFAIVVNYVGRVDGFSIRIYMDPDPLAGTGNAIENFIPTFETYLSSELNRVLGKSYTFELFLYNESQNMDHLISNQSIHFYYGTAAATACLEASYAALPIATIVKPMPGGGEIDGYGGAIVASASNTRLNSLSDIKGSIIGVEYQQGWGSNLLQMDALIKSGVYAYRDAKEVVTGNQETTFAQNKMLEAVHTGLLDVAFVRADTVYNFQLMNVTKSSYFKVLGALPGITIPGTSTPYPFPVSSPIYPEWSLSAFPWVDKGLSWRVLNAVLALNASSRPAVAGSYVRWEPAVDYGAVRSVLEDTGALLTDAAGRRRCLWLESGYNIYSMPACPPGSFKVAEATATQACRALDRPGPGPACWCGVCQAAREIEIFAAGLGGDGSDGGPNTSLCDKMQPCAAAPQRAGFNVTVRDSLLRAGLRVTCSLGGLGAAPDLVRTLEPGPAPWIYSADIAATRVGMYLLQVHTADR